MEQAPDEETAVLQANKKARQEWEGADSSGNGSECPSGKELGYDCPVCAGAQAVTDEEYAEWKKDLKEYMAMQ
jgi:hypothetical protein